MMLINEAGQAGTSFSAAQLCNGERGARLRHHKRRSVGPTAAAAGNDADSNGAGDERKSRRELVMASVNFAVLGSTVNSPDLRTAVNSLLGMTH